MEIDVFESLRERLTTGVFEHGDKLKPEELRKDFACSASALREALFRLSTVGLVEFREQRGFRVPEISVVRQHELTQMRILLEAEGACLSIRLGGLAWEARLIAAHHKLSHIESRVHDNTFPKGLIRLWSSAELEFHETLIDACGSATLRNTHAVIYQQFRQQLITTDRQFVYVPENIQQHQEILNAALNRDENLVRKRVAEHLSRNLSHPLPARAEPLVQQA